MVKSFKVHFFYEAYDIFYEKCKKTLVTVAFR